jgi:hypothetical protein
MTTEQVYNRFIIKINENATTDGLSCDRGKFVIFCNNATNKKIESCLDRRFEDDIRYVQKILVDDKKLSSPNTHLDHTDFQIPDDFFDNSNLYILASKGECNKQKIDCYEIKDDDRNNILRDDLQNPSFKYREAPYHIASNKIKVYTKDDFTIDDAILSYYRYPVQVGLVDPEDPESKFNNNNPEFDDKFMADVISLCASEFFLNSDNQKYQAEKANAIQKP